MIKNENQELIINSKDNLLVLASAGCGKTFTITKKIDNLLTHILPSEILVISFTNESVKDLKKKLYPNINILTFHKLAMKVLDDNKISYSLANEELLKLTIDDYFLNHTTRLEKKKLKRYFFEFNFSLLLESKKFADYKSIIFTFIKLMQCNNYDFEFLKNAYKTTKDKFLVSLIMKIYYLYNEEKNSCDVLDLDDLIIKAGQIARENKFNYKYIFVDEFQDTSEIRFNLIYNIFKNSNSTINFFGDDFQSIYAFSGCNLSIMLNIKEKIPDIKTINLDKNYRSDDHLIKTANAFVLKNPHQLRKNVSSQLNIKNAVNYVYYNDFKKELNNLIKKLELVTDDIMFLGRYKSDLALVPSKFKKMTIHESKGLEARYVVLLNLKDDIYGFPSKVKNHNLLDVFSADESFSFAEERRIFYVATTRAKEKLFLFIPKKDKSVFIKEFIKIEKKTLK